MSIVITSTANTIKISFNNASKRFGLVKGCFSRAQIGEVAHLYRGGILLTMLTEHGVKRNYKLSFNGENGARVNTIDGVAVASDSQLYNLLGALIR